MSVTQVEVESHVFPPEVKPSGSDKTFFLAGAGVRGLEIHGKFIKFTAIAIYLEHHAVPALSAKWKGKTTEELTDSVDFFKDIVTGPFEKLTQVRMILPLTGQQYSEKVVENCVAYWKSVGTFTDAESEATQNFLQLFKDQTFPPGASILFTQSPLGSLTISFSKDGSLPEKGNELIENEQLSLTEKGNEVIENKQLSLPKKGIEVIQNKQLSEAVLESIIGKHGVSPEAKQSLAVRLSDLFKLHDNPKLE